MLKKSRAIGLYEALVLEFDGLDVLPPFLEVVG
jgi:hypothetical protein